MQGQFLELNKLEYGVDDKGYPTLRLSFSITISRDPMLEIMTVLIPQKPDYIMLWHRRQTAKTFVATIHSCGVRNIFETPFTIRAHFLDMTIWHSGPMPSFDDGYGERVIQDFPFTLTPSILQQKTLIVD